MDANILLISMKGQVLRPKCLNGCVGEGIKCVLVLFLWYKR